MKKYFKSELQYGLALIVGGLLLGKVNFMFNPWTVFAHLGMFTTLRLIGYGVSIYGGLVVVKYILKKIINFIN